MGRLLWERLAARFRSFHGGQRLRLSWLESGAADCHQQKKEDEKERYKNQAERENGLSVTMSRGATDKGPVDAQVCLEVTT